MVALAASTPSTSFHEFTGNRDDFRAILAVRAGSIEMRVVREITDDQRRAAAAARVSDEQLALLETDTEPTD